MNLHKRLSTCNLKVVSLFECFRLFLRPDFTADLPLVGLLTSRS